MSAYFVTSIRLRGENLRMLEKIGECVSRIRSVWVIQADWNCTPFELEASRWLEKVGGVIFSVGYPTCDVKRRPDASGEARVDGEGGEAVGWPQHAGQE
eukprot:7588099-Pyramimonas_sp.AAC.1